MLKLADKIIFFFTLIAVIGLCGAYIARFVNPNTFVVFSLFGLAYPYLLVGNILLLFYWIARWKKISLFLLAVLALGIPSFTSYYGTHKAMSSASRSDWTVLSYNVRYLDRYRWTKDKNTKEKILHYLQGFNGDVICLQEFPEVPSSSGNKGEKRFFSSHPYETRHKNLALFSRHPVLRSGHLSFGEKYSSTCLFCDIAKGKDTVRFYSIHLESYKLGTKERKFMKEITSGTSDNLSEGVKNILSRIVTANKNRAVQAQKIKSHIERSPYPVVLCGDFNDTPLSFTYRTLQKGLKDSFIERGRGLGNTYIGEFPSFRIDYILHSPSFVTVDYVREKIVLSDHYPIVSRFNAKK